MTLHALDRPGPDDLVRSLREVVGPRDAEAAINVAVRDAVSPTAALAELSPAQLLGVARALIRQRGAVAMIGRSFEIRMLSYLELAQTDAGAPAAALDERERARLGEVAALDLAADLDEPALQALVDRAAAELDLPIATVSIVLDSAQYFVASRGLGGWIGAAAGTPGEWAFCRNAIDSHEPFIVEDASNHPLVRDNPLVQFDGIRCYLGIPLVTRNGEALGTLCVLGVEPRNFAMTDIERLRALAAEVLALLEARRVD